MFSVLKNNENKKNNKNMFGFYFVFFLKKKKNTKFKEQKRVFREHIFGVFCTFKNCSQEQFSKTKTKQALSFIFHKNKIANLRNKK